MRKTVGCIPGKRSMMQEITRLRFPDSMASKVFDECCVPLVIATPLKWMAGSGKRRGSREDVDTVTDLNC